MARQERLISKARRLGAINASSRRMKRYANISIQASMVYAWLWMGPKPSLSERAALAPALQQPNATISSWKCLTKTGRAEQTPICSSDPTSGPDCVTCFVALNIDLRPWEYSRLNRRHS